MHATNDERDFKKQLRKQGINVVVRRNDAGRIYGITFIDHNSKAVWNGSRIGKELSTNIFNDYWNNNIKPDIKEPSISRTKLFISNDADLPVEGPHHLFGFLTTDKHEDGLIGALGGLLLEVQGEDYEEFDFANKMKKKRKRQRGQR